MSKKVFSTRSSIIGLKRFQADVSNAPYFVHWDATLRALQYLLCVHERLGIVMRNMDRKFGLDR